METGTRPESPGNNLLRALRRTTFEAVEPYLRRVRAESGEIIHEQGSPVHFAFFPCGSSIASFDILLKEGKSVEAALIGREGAIGGVFSLGNLPAYARARVQYPGEFLKIDIVHLDKLAMRLPALRQHLAIYADCLMAQLFQSVACNASHSMEQRLARWLLSALDRTGSDEVPWTQEQLASMLGVGRSYMSRVIQKLKGQGILETRRGGLYVRNAVMLHRMCCGCHDAVRLHFDSVLKGVYPANGMY